MLLSYLNYVFYIAIPSPVQFGTFSLNVCSGMTGEHNAMSKQTKNSHVHFPFNLQHLEEFTPLLYNTCPLSFGTNDPINTGPNSTRTPSPVEYQSPMS